MGSCRANMPVDVLEYYTTMNAVREQAPVTLPAKKVNDSGWVDSEEEEEMTRVKHAVLKRPPLTTGDKVRRERKEGRHNGKAASGKKRPKTAARNTEKDTNGGLSSRRPTEQLPVAKMKKTKKKTKKRANEDDTDEVPGKKPRAPNLVGIQEVDTEGMEARDVLREPDAPGVDDGQKVCSLKNGGSNLDEEARGSGGLLVVDGVMGGAREQRCEVEEDRITCGVGGIEESLGEGVIAEGGGDTSSNLTVAVVSDDGDPAPSLRPGECGVGPTGCCMAGPPLAPSQERVRDITLCVVKGDTCRDTVSTASRMLADHGHTGLSVWHTIGGDTVPYTNPAAQVEETIHGLVRDELVHLSGRYGDNERWVRAACGFLHDWHVGGRSGVRLDPQMATVDTAMEYGMGVQLTDRLSLYMLVDQAIGLRGRCDGVHHCDVKDTVAKVSVLSELVIVRGYGAVIRPSDHVSGYSIPCSFLRCHVDKWKAVWTEYMDSVSDTSPDYSIGQWTGTSGFVWLTRTPDPDTSMHLVHYTYDPTVDPELAPLAPMGKGGKVFERDHGGRTCVEGDQPPGTVDLVATEPMWPLVHCVEWAQPRDGQPHRGPMPHAQVIRSCAIPIAAIEDTDVFNSIASLVYACSNRINFDWRGLIGGQLPSHAWVPTPATVTDIQREHDLSSEQIEMLMRMRPDERSVDGNAVSYTTNKPIDFDEWTEKYGAALRSYVSTGKIPNGTDPGVCDAMYHCLSRLRSDDIEAIARYMC